MNKAINFDEKMQSLSEQIFLRKVNLSESKGDIPEWDSLNHLKLILLFEEHFGQRVPIDKVDKIDCLMDFREFI